MTDSRRLVAAYDRAVTTALYRMNVYLASRSGFAHSVVFSLVWVTGAYSLDLFPSTRSVAAGLVFAYLAFATAFSFVTQFNITHVAESASRTAEESRLRAEAADDRTILILEGIATADESDRSVLTALAKTLENQGHMIEAIVELSRREIALSDRMEEALAQIVDMQIEATARHIENQRLIRALFRATRPLGKVAVAEGAKVKRVARGE